MNNLCIGGGQKHYEIIDYLKGFSIFTIVIMHLIQNYINVPDIIFKASSMGGAGVHVFLFCSGFGLYISQEKKCLSQREFIKYRAVKIYIPYIFVVSIAAIIPFTFKGNHLIAWMSHVLLFKMFLEKYETSFGPYWYISTLIQFYIVFIPMYRGQKRIGGKRAFILFVTISMLWWMFITVTGLGEKRVWGSFFLQYIWEFSLGMFVGEILYEGKTIRIPYKMLIMTMVCGIVIAALAVTKGGAYRYFNDIPSMAGYMSLALLLYVLKIDIFRKIFIYISAFSYELYLTHMLVFMIGYHFIRYKQSWQWVVAIVMFAVSVIIAILYHKLVQRYQLIQFFK